MTDAPLLSVRGLTVSFASRGDGLLAVRGVDLTLARGEVLGLVGESGSGKSATMMAVMGLLPSTAIVGGSAVLDGEELVGRPERLLRTVRGKRIGMIFQDPMTALDPILKVGDQIGEAIRVHDRSVGRKAAYERAIDLLAAVAIPSPRQRAGQYPHEFSGGMRQRVVIATAIANDPDLLIADEPTTALDVTIQAQIVELLQRLCAERRMGLILVTHDLGLVAGIASGIAVMYAGRVVEDGPVGPTLGNPSHPYTRSLLASLPRLDRRVQSLTAIKGAPPSLAALPSGCTFHPRCPIAIDVCTCTDPVLHPVGAGRAACHRAEEVAALLPLHEAAA